jgi:hypothetical protein
VVSVDENRAAVASNNPLCLLLSAVATLLPTMVLLPVSPPSLDES